MRVIPQSGNPRNSDQAFFAALAALNLKFEAARTGKSAYEMAQSSEMLLAAFLAEIRAGHRAKE